jgi:hypothetical protein
MCTDMHTCRTWNLKKNASFFTKGWPKIKFFEIEFYVERKISLLHLLRVRIILNFVLSLEGRKRSQ